MKVIAGIVGGLLFAWSATLIASLLAAVLFPAVNGVAWFTFLATFTAAFVFALSARSARMAWCYLLSAAGVLWIASAATFFAVMGKPTIWLNPASITETALFMMGVICLGIGWSVGKSAARAHAPQ